MKLLFICGIFATFSANCAEIQKKSVTFSQFAAALAKVESNNNPKAIGDNGRAIGLLQIQSKCFQDAAKFDKELNKFSYSHCFDPRVSKRVLWAYCSKYEAKALQNNDWITLAKLWNGGCGWRTKTGAAKNRLDIYVGKLGRELARK